MAQGCLYAIRLPSNEVLEREVQHLLKRPVGRPSRKPVVRYQDFWYQAGSWDRPRGVVAKVEWRQAEGSAFIGGATILDLAALGTV